MELVFVVFGLSILIFSIYFFFKSIQFVIKAINLYKDMIYRQDVIIKLLDNISKCCSSQNELLVNLSKRYLPEKDLSGKKHLGSKRCPECKKIVDNLNPNSFCEYCGFKFI